MITVLTKNERVEICTRLVICLPPVHTNTHDAEDMCYMNYTLYTTLCPACTQ